MTGSGDTPLQQEEAKKRKKADRKPWWLRPENLPPSISTLAVALTVLATGATGTAGKFVERVLHDPNTAVAVGITLFAGLGTFVPRILRYLDSTSERLSTEVEAEIRAITEDRTRNLERLLDAQSRLLSEIATDSDSVSLHRVEELMGRIVDLEARLRTAAEENDGLRDSEKRFDGLVQQPVKRILQEIGRLEKRGNLNLAFGFFLALCGLGVLGFVLLRGPAIQGAKDVLWGLPRITFALAWEVFAYFFLGLYRSSLSDIKYYQNEITNIEMLRASFSLGVVQGAHPALEVIVGRLAATERNFKLLKGERTVISVGTEAEVRDLHRFMSTLRSFIPAAPAEEKEKKTD